MMKLKLAGLLLLLSVIAVSAALPPIQYNPATTNAGSALTNAIKAIASNDLSSTYIAANLGKGTNTALYSGTGTHALVVTNDNTTNFVVDMVLGNTGIGDIFFSQSPGDAAYGKLRINTIHDGTPPSPSNVEFEWSTPGNMAWGVGKHFQRGIVGASLTQWEYEQSMLNVSVSTPYGYSMAHTWRASGFVNGAAVDYLPGILAQYTDTNTTSGLYELDIFRDLGNNTGPGGNFNNVWDVTTLKHGVQIYGGNKYGVRLNGGLVLERSSTSSSAANVTLDFASTAVRDITLSGANVAITTAGWFAGVTNAEPRIFVLRGAASSTLTYPIGSTGWNTNGVLPTSLLAGQKIVLRLLACGQGETNVDVFDAQLFPDNAFSWDADALAFFTRASITDAIQKAAVNKLVTDLKAASLWAKMDVIYPFVGGNATAHSKNLKANTFNITWTASPTHSASGVAFNGSTQYGDTGFNPASASSPNYIQNSATIFAWVTSGASLTDDTTLIGAVATHYGTITRVNSTSMQAKANSSAGGNTYGGVTWSGAVASIRTSSSQDTAARGTTYTSSALASTGVPNATFYVGAENNGGLWKPASVTLGGAAVGSGLSSGDWASWQSAWATYNSTLGR